MRKRIELLKEIKESGQELVNIQSDIVMAETMIRCIDIEDMRAKIQAAEDDKSASKKNRTGFQKSRGYSRAAVRSAARVYSGMCGFEIERLRK